MKEKKRLFFGWENIKWTLRELRNLYSPTKSYFSKKRVESGLAYLIGQSGMIFFLVKKYEVMSVSDLIMWAGAEFLLSGYTVFQIQKEKKSEEKKEIHPEEGEY